MFTISAFADEISPDPREQLAVLKASRVRFIEFRSIHKTNVMKLTDTQLKEFKSMLDGEGVGISAIGSPLGKYAIDAPFQPQLDMLGKAIELCGMFNTKGIRIFSGYPPAEKAWDKDWAPYREEVIRRLQAMADVAAKANITLYHENEHNIYGDKPERVVDIMTSVKSPALKAAYDAANWVFCGYDPVKGWELTKEFTTHLHIKDWKKPQPGDDGHGHGVIAGTGDGHMSHSIKDAVQRGYKGFAVMEPHLRGGGPTGGVTGADLFPYAVDAFRKILKDCGGTEG
jgi:3-dehydroshikimate dehydratase